MRKHIRLSVSKAKTFEQCKRKFYYTYLLKLPRESNIYSAVGSAVHLVLELFFKRWIESKYLADMHKLMNETWKECQSSKEFDIARQFNVVDQAKQYVKAYFHYYIDVEFKTEAKPIKCEQSFSLPITIGDDLLIEIGGFIDRIDEIGPKKVRILDYKTTGKISYLDDFQLGIYVAAAQAGPYKGYDFEAAYILLKHGNRMRPMENANETYLQHLEQMIVIAQEIDEFVEKGEWKPTYSPLCRFCEYRARCQSDTGGEEQW